MRSKQRTNLHLYLDWIWHTGDKITDMLNLSTLPHSLITRAYNIVKMHAIKYVTRCQMATLQTALSRLGDVNRLWSVQLRTFHLAVQIPTGITVLLHA